MISLCTFGPAKIRVAQCFCFGSVVDRCRLARCCPCWRPTVVVVVLDIGVVVLVIVVVVVAVAVSVVGVVGVGCSVQPKEGQQPKRQMTRSRWKAWSHAATQSHCAVEVFKILRQMCFLLWLYDRFIRKARVEVEVAIWIQNSI